MISELRDTMGQMGVRGKLMLIAVFVPTIEFDVTLAARVTGAGNNDEFFLKRMCDGDSNLPPTAFI